MKNYEMTQRKNSSLTIQSPLAGVLAVMTALTLCLGLAPGMFAAPVGLGAAADYAVLGVGGTPSISSDFSVYQSATVINGNVGMGPYTELTHNIDCTINGRFDYDLTDTVVSSDVTGTITGGIQQIDLSKVVQDARDASTAAAALIPTQTYTKLTEGQIIVGNGGLNVIRITGQVTLKKSLTIQGSATDEFVFQFTAAAAPSAHTLTLSGMTMILVGGVLPENILWNLDGLGGGVVIKAGAQVFGTFLAPERDITSDHGIIEGRLIGGGDGRELDVHSGSEVTSPETPKK